MSGFERKRFQLLKSERKKTIKEIREEGGGGGEEEEEAAASFSRHYLDSS